MTRDYINEIKTLISTASENGWQPCPGKPNTLRRITRHKTPATIPSNWWAQPEYQAVEFLTFILSDLNRAPKAVHGTSRTPWIGRCDQSISYKRATELMRQSVGQSPVHTGH